MSFNHSAREKFDLQSYRHCVLFYDEKPRRIGIEFTNDSTTEDILSVKHTPTGTSISGKRFLDYFDILPSETATYKVRQNAQGLIEVSLKRIHRRSHRIQKGNKVAENP
jgi:hypothetical protein